MSEQQRIEKEADEHASDEPYEQQAGKSYRAGANATRLRYVEEIQNLKTSCHKNADESTEWFKRCIELQNVIRELIPIAEWGIPGFAHRLWNPTGSSSMEEMLNANTAIERAKKLIE